MKHSLRARLRSILFLAFMALLLPLHPAHAELWEYVDEHGNRHYFQSIDQMPEDYRDKARRIDGEQLPTSKKIAPATKPVAAPAPAVKVPTDSEGRTQAYWCRRKKDLEDKAAALEKRKGELESTGAVDLTQGGGVKAAYEIGRELEQVKKDLAATQAELKELPNEARKAGAPAGWLRGSSCPVEGPEKADGDVSDEKVGPEKGSREWWQAQKAALDARRASLEKQIAEAEAGKVGQTGASYDPIIASRNKEIDGRVNALRSQLGEVESDLEALSEQARKAGVPPEWVR